MAEAQTTHQAPPATFREVVDLWPTRPAFAEAIGIPNGTAQQMRNRGSIDSKYWLRIVEAAQKIGRDDVTYELLARLDHDMRGAA